MSVIRNIKNILAVRNDRFGEFLLNIPAFRALKKTYREAKLTLVVNPYVWEVAQCIDSADELISWENKKHKFREIVKFSQELKDKKFDLCVIFNPFKELNIITFLAGIPVRVGYARKWGFLLTHKMEDKKYLGQKHEVEYNLELVNLVGAETKDKSLSLKIDNRLAGELFRDFNLNNFNNLIALHPWTSDPIKQWSINNFRELAERLIGEPDLKLVLIGSKEQIDKSRQFFGDFSDRLIDMTGKTSLTQLGLVLGKCRLLISGDSGPVHLASCMGIPVIAIFRNDLPGKSAKRWGPWGEGHIVIEKRDLYDITVDEVFNKIKEVLHK